MKRCYVHLSSDSVHLLLFHFYRSEWNRTVNDRQTSVGRRVTESDVAVLIDPMSGTALLEAFTAEIAVFPKSSTTTTKRLKLWVIINK